MKIFFYRQKDLISRYKFQPWVFVVCRFKLELLPKTILHGSHLCSISKDFFSVVYYYCSEDSFSDRCLNTCSQYALSDCYFWHSFYYKSGKMSFFKQHETFSVTLWYIYVYLRFSNLSITISFFIFRCCIFRVILGFFRFRFEVNRFCCRFIVLTVKIRDVLLNFFSSDLKLQRHSKHLYSPKYFDWVWLSSPLFYLKAELQWGHFSLLSSVKSGLPSGSDPSSYSELFVSSIGSYSSSE